MKKSKSKKGFTLIELLIVIFIIGILAGTVAINVSKWRARTRDSQRVADIRTLQNALALYQTISGGNYPECDGEIAITGSDACFSSVLKGAGVITTVPVDPINGTSDCSEDYIYTYCSESSCTLLPDETSYWIRYYLETGAISGQQQCPTANYVTP